MDNEQIVLRPANKETVIPRIEVKLPDGATLVAQPSNDPEYPGIYVDYVKDGDTTLASRPSVLMEYNVEESKLRALVWADKHSEDYSDEIEFDIKEKE